MTELNRDAIVSLLARNDLAVARALVVLNNNQTADEQSLSVTSHLNGKGFRPCDAHMGTSMANAFKKYGRLTEKQIAYWRKPNSKGVMRIAIYWRQLILAAQEKASRAA